MKNLLKLAICQMKVLDNKKENLTKATEQIRNAAAEKADFIVLPEMFNCPYANSKFAEYGESIEEGETVHTISSLARELGVYITAGSIPEISNGKLYNTSVTFDRKGLIIGVHRKLHLFDIHILGGITFRESDTLASGNSITIVDTEFCKIGVAICYDLRFPELFRIMALKGVKIVVVPAAFNTVTGPVHWEPLIRIRAIDNQVYLAAVSPARDESSEYQAYGNSMVVDPWGRILGQASEKEEMVCVNIDLELVEKIRNELPLLKHRRNDIYELVDKTMT